jgi:hypothetical protein
MVVPIQRRPERPRCELVCVLVKARGNVRAPGRVDHRAAREAPLLGQDQGERTEQPSGHASGRGGAPVTLRRVLASGGVSFRGGGLGEYEQGVGAVGVGVHDVRLTQGLRQRDRAADVGCRDAFTQTFRL